MKTLSDPQCSVDLVLGTERALAGQSTYELLAEPLGLRLSALIGPGRVEFLRRDGSHVALADLLLSDHYTKAIARFHELLPELPPVGTLLNFTFDYGPGGALLFDATSVRLLGDLLSPEARALCSLPELLPEGTRLSTELVEALRARDAQAVWSLLLPTGEKLSPRFWAITLRRGAYGVRIPRPGGTEAFEVRYEHSNLYSLLSVDVVRTARLEVLSAPSDADDEYVRLVDPLFLSYLRLSKYDLPSLDLGMPEVLRVAVDEKLPFLSSAVREVIEREPALYDLYRLFLSLLRQSHLRGNPYATAGSVTKHREVVSKIQQVQELGDLAVPLPSFDPQTR